MFVIDLLGYNLRSPLVGGGITVTVKDLGGVIAQQGVYFVFTVAPVCVQKVWQILCQTDNGDAFRPGGRLKDSVLVDGEPVGFVNPQKHGPSLCRCVVAPVNCAMKKLLPDQGCELTYLPELGNRDVDHDNFAIENVVRALVSVSAEQLANFPACQRIEHTGKIGVYRFACFRGKRRALDHPIIDEKLPFWVV